MLATAALLGAGAGASALPEDADQPIHIRADHAEIDQQAQRVIYRGAVQVDQGTLQVTAAEMIVEYQDQQVTRITAHGTPAKYRQQIDEESGEVNADARTIIYHTRDERLDLEGEALLIQDGNEITGERIRYDIVAGRVDAESGPEAPVRMILQPATRSD